MEAITPIFDGHNDTLLRVVREPDFDFFRHNEGGHMDLPRARRGGLIGAIFAIYTPPPADSPEASWEWELEVTESGYRQPKHSAIDPAWAEAFTTQAFDALDALIDRSGGQARVALTAAEIERCAANGRLAIVAHLEGAEAIRADLSNLDYYYGRGLRSIGLVWSRPNAFAEGVPFAFPASPDTGPGLTEAGRALVAVCNRMGILVDLAHINERGFWDVAEISAAPLVVSHADCHALLPSTRNVTDAQIAAVARSGGLIGLNFEPMQIGEGGRPASDVPLANLARHVEHIASRAGIDYVALGSDFDGTDMPSALRDAAGLQGIAQALRDAGFDQEAVEKVTFRNWLRVLRATWGG